MFKTVLSLLSLLALASGACVDNFTLVQDIGCFNFDSPDLVTWVDATDYCHRHGGALLAEPSTESIQAGLLPFLLERPSTDYWIGLTDALNEGTFMWHTTVQNATFTAWAWNQPNGGEMENCVSMRHENTFFWTDENCLHTKTPLCYTYEN